VREGSEIAPDERKTAGRQVKLVTQWLRRQTLGGGLTSPDRQAIPFNA
jgi:hypothetical protein